MSPTQMRKTKPSRTQRLLLDMIHASMRIAAVEKIAIVWGPESSVSASSVRDTGDVTTYDGESWSDTSTLGGFPDCVVIDDPLPASARTHSVSSSGSQSRFVRPMATSSTRLDSRSPSYQAGGA